MSRGRLEILFSSANHSETVWVSLRYVHIVELRHLRYFTAVVAAGSFTAAAAALRVSQPPLSVAIAKLEAEFGVDLLVRTARGAEPTSAGRYLLDAASRILGDVDDTIAALGRYGAGTAGSLTIAAVPVLMWHRVPVLLRAFHLAVPDVEVRIVDPPPWAAIDMIKKNVVDLAAIMVTEPERFRQRYGNSFDIVDWGDVPLVAVLPPASHDVLDPVPWTIFEDAVVVLPRRTAAVASLPEAVESSFHRHGIVPRAVRTVETIQISLPLIESGIAVGILPDPDYASLGRFDVTLRRLHPAPEPLRALVIARPGATRLGAVGQFIEQLHAGRR